MASLGPPSRRRTPVPRRSWQVWLGLVAPAVVAAVLARLPAPGTPVVHAALEFIALKLGADILRARAWPRGERFVEDIAREWLAWLLLTAVAVGLTWLATRFGRAVLSPLWPSLLTYWILWVGAG